MAAVAFVSSKRAPTSALAFAYDLPFLAAGTPPGATTGARLSIFGAPAPDVGFRDIDATFPSPAGFCSLAWSKPTDTGCPSWSPSAGLVAGGLESGAVAIWDPRSQLRDVENSNNGGWKSGFEVISDYFSPEGRRKPPSPDITNSNLLAATSSDTSDGAVLVWDQPPNLRDEENSSNRGWNSGFDLIDDYFSPGKQPKPPRPDTTNGNLVAAGSSDTSDGAVLAWDWPPNLRNLGLRSSSEGTSEWGHGFRLNCSPSRLDAAAADSAMVALFSNHLGPVRGLSFSSSQPNLLASGTAQGKIMIWDLASQQRIPALQCSGFDTSEISCLSWSPLTNVIASTSLHGTSIWDISASSPLIWNFESNRNFCAVEWSPTDPNVMIVSADDCRNPTSLLIFDRRMMEKPIKEFCEKSGGVISTSWCPYQDKLIISCRNKSLMIWCMKSQQLLWEGHNLAHSEFTDVHWSKTSIGVFAATSGEDIRLYSVEGEGSQDC